MLLIMMHVPSFCQKCVVYLSSRSYTEMSYYPFLNAACEEISHASGDTLRPWVSSIGETIKDSSIKKHMQIVLFSPQVIDSKFS